MWLTLWFIVSLAFAEGSAIEEKISTDSGQYSVMVEPSRKKIEVKKIDGPGGPPHMRVRILRKDNRPLELRLHTLNNPKLEPTYSGKIDSWSDSHLGLELEVSFDRKTWKKLGSALFKALP